MVMVQDKPGFSLDPKFIMDPNSMPGLLDQVPTLPKGKMWHLGNYKRVLGEGCETGCQGCPRLQGNTTARPETRSPIPSYTLENMPYLNPK